MPTINNIDGNEQLFTFESHLAITQKSFVDFGNTIDASRRVKIEQVAASGRSTCSVLIEIQSDSSFIPQTVHNW